MSQHTPGPWKIEYAETRMRWPVIYVEDEAWDGGRREIVSLSTHVARRMTDDKWRKTRDAAESEANARLIAAAPRMLKHGSLTLRSLNDRLEVLEDAVKAKLHGAEAAYEVLKDIRDEWRAILRDVEDQS